MPPCIGLLGDPGGCLQGGDEVPARAEDLGNLIAFIATCGPYAPRDGLRIYARIAADYSAFNARAWQFRYGQPIVAGKCSVA